LPTSEPRLIDGLGFSGITADSENAEARIWFDQGVRLVWAFDEAEAVRAFTKAQQLDPHCALCSWGEAWARSPTINLPRRSGEFAAAKAAAAKAASLGARLSERDRLLVESLRIRTGGKTGFDGKAYAKAMVAAAGRLPGDDTLGILAADALMQMGDRLGPSRARMIQSLLETVLKRSPNHSGAIHFYIHLTDWTGDQALALPFADRLGRLAPAASHLVHMPSHSFFGVGRYRDAMNANLAALAAERAYAAKVGPPATAYRTGLDRHNMNFAIASALMIGDAATALATANIFRNLYDDAPEDVGAQFPRASAFFAFAVYGSTREVMALPEPSEKTPLLRAMRYYARGEMLARAGDPAGIRAEAAALEQARTAKILAPDVAPWGGAMLEIAQHVLEGRAAMLEGRGKAAEAAFRKAMAKQGKASFSFDPPTWYYPVRRSVAAALIAQKDYRRARLQLLASLGAWPNDPVAFNLLAIVEKALGREAESKAYLARARAGWIGGIDRMSLPLA
jgi:tetratricopeptide (TPR) repeat protein